MYPYCTHIKVLLLSDFSELNVKKCIIFPSCVVFNCVTQLKQWFLLESHVSQSCGQIFSFSFFQSLICLVSTIRKASLFFLSLLEPKMFSCNHYFLDQYLSALATCCLRDFFYHFFLHSRLLPLYSLKSTGGPVRKVFLKYIKWEIFNNHSQSKCRLLKILSHRCVLGMISFFDNSVTEFFVILHRKKKLIRQWVHRHITVYL